MADIADHNSGEIVEVEHHDKPITLSIAVNKNIGKRWEFRQDFRFLSEIISHSWYWQLSC